MEDTEDKINLQITLDTCSCPTFHLKITSNYHNNKKTTSCYLVHRENRERKHMSILDWTHIHLATNIYLPRNLVGSSYYTLWRSSLTFHPIYLARSLTARWIRIDEAPWHSTPFTLLIVLLQGEFESTQNSTREVTIALPSLSCLLASYKFLWSRVYKAPTLAAARFIQPALFLSIVAGRPQ